MLEFAHQEHVKSYYLDSRNQTFELPPLTQQEEADVCVIGAGVFGLSVAAGSAGCRAARKDIGTLFMQRGESNG